MKNDSNSNYTSLVNSLMTPKLHEQFNKSNNIFTSVEQSRMKKKKRVTYTDNHLFFWLLHSTCFKKKEKENLIKDLLSIVGKLSGNLVEIVQIMNSWWNNKWFSSWRSSLHLLWTKLTIENSDGPASNNNKYNT